jgi:hypothetical protein
MIYKTSKLASEISKISDIPQMVVWDILNELGYEPQELTQHGVNKWAVKVERKLKME